ncbi:MAG: VWA domain-containing protein [Bryobacterales bacterium]|nr:VWA domain-containing protein [Bryobacterales bacterium]MBV9399558.1 VWA domain-containing protein [Bryobacterales bacterium]
MTFDRSWVLAIAWLPIAWGLWEWSRTRRRLALALKALALTAILLALAQPKLSVQETKVALAVLVDTSASVSSPDLQKASQLTRDMRDAQGRHWMRVVPFARSTRDLDRGESQQWTLRQTSGEAGRATDLEAAVREAVASLPGGLVPRVALISDGMENKGSIARAAWQAQQLGIPIDTFPLSGRTRPALRLESISLPSMAFTGEQFPIDLVVSAPKAESAQIELDAEGRMLGKMQAPLQAGSNSIRLHTSLNTPGALDLSISVHSEDGGDIRFEQAVMLRKPKVLYISDDPPDLDSHLAQTLTAAQFELERTRDISSPRLNDYQLVILNNLDLESTPVAFKEKIEKYEKEGGGVLVIAGEHSVYIEKDKNQEDALNRALPATLAPPRSPEGTAVVLIIDKSSSMEGRKIELARAAASGVVENLRPIDTVGVLIFDNSFEWAVTMRKAEDRANIKKMIAGIRPDGGTQIAPALTEAFQRVLPTTAAYKHIVLLTDGISEEGDSFDLARQANNRKITISTVGLGQDVNRSYLEKIAQFAGGKSYFLNEPQGLEQILLHDVLEHTGSTAVEKQMPPEVVKNAEILEGVGIESAPPLKGYVRFIAKPSAETILRVDRKEPLLARWQYGLGRSAVFTSDAKTRWATDWVNWKGYDKFWTNVTRDLLPRSQAGEAVLTFDSAESDLVVDYRLGREVEDPAKIPEIFVLGPDNFRKPIPVKKVAAGTFRGRLNVGSRQGLFRVRPVEDSRAFPEAGLYRPEAELQDYGSNTALLKQVAEFTGGRYQPDPRDVFEPGRRSIMTSLQLWPGLLAAAVIMSLAELVMRKWKGVFGAK